MEQIPETIVCPFCGNVNPFSQESCIKCRKPLEPIRQAMGFNPPNLEKPDIPLPVLPTIPERPVPIDKENSQALKFYANNSFLIRGMGSKLDNILCYFYQQLVNRKIQEFFFSTGSISLSTEGNVEDTRQFYFAERHIGEGALSIMAVRFALSGTDLFVEWRNYALPSIRQKEKYNLGKHLLWYVGTLGFGIILYPIKLLTQKNRKDDLEGFQYEENQSFQLSVRAALEEAIDLAGISKTFIQDVGKEGNKDQRVI